MRSRQPRHSASPSAPRRFTKLLAANRSEIAIRIFRAATELGLRTVAIYAQEDRFCIHRFKADEAYLVGEGKGPVAAYLDIEGIVALAKEKGVDAIHPGYGFLSENAEFARACARAGITFVGPAAGIAGNDGRQDRRARPGPAAWRCRRSPARRSRSPIARRRSKIARDIGFPLIIKAAFGGGGRGMRVVQQGGRPGAPAGRGAGRGRPRVRQPGGVPGEIHPARQAHRSADPRRPARQRHSPARARLLGAAPPPEGRRGRAELWRCPKTIVRELCDAAVAHRPRDPLRQRRARSSSSTTWTATSGSSSR